MMWERKYGDFFQKPPNLVPQIKLWYLGIFFISLFYKNETQYLFEKINQIKYKV